MIKYLGSKRLLVPTLVQVFQCLAASGTVIDLFSGTSRVGYAAKQAGYRVFANDINAYALEIGQCYVQSNLEDWEFRAADLIQRLNKLNGQYGYFSETFCEKSRFFQLKNGMRIDAIRERIEEMDLETELRSIALVSLMEAADRVDSTCGVQMAYLKQWAPRSFNDLELRMPALLPQAKSGKGIAFCTDAAFAARNTEGDICYIDPPYNQHSYLGNYHIWESLVLWDKPNVYGVACKREDVRERHSAFNRKREAEVAMFEVIHGVRAPHVVVSFNDEGYLSRAQIEDMLRKRGDVVVIEQDFKRYVGAQIGIHNRAGEKVGEVGKLRNKELIFVGSKDGAALDRVRQHFGMDKA